MSLGSLLMRLLISHLGLLSSIVQILESDQGWFQTQSGFLTAVDFAYNSIQISSFQSPITMSRSVGNSVVRTLI